MRSALRLTAVVLLILMLSPEVRADYREFIPRISSYAGFLSVDSSYENQKDTTNGRGIRTRDTFLRQTLDLDATGYVYDPRFITFVLRYSGGVKEESFSIGPENKPFKTMWTNQYNFRMYVLPEHPYNLELFALRVEPLERRTYLESESVAYSKGAVFRYTKKPYFFNAHYIDDSTDTPVGTFTTRKYGALGTYFKELGGEKFYSYSGSYEHTTYSPGGTANTAALGNNYTLKAVTLASNLSYADSDQSDGPFSLSLSSKTMSWGERAYLRLPWNFNVGLSYIWNKNKLKTSGMNVPEQDFTATTNNVAFTISQKLYNSLLTNYGFGYNALRTDRGRTKTVSNNLGFVYSKEIPWGRMRAEVSGDRLDTRRNGVQSVPNEVHSGIRVPGSFTLNNPDVDQSTLFIYLRSAFIAEGLVPLQENVNYVVENFGNTLRITIVSLPQQFAVPGTYTFYVSYTLNNAQSRLVTTDLRYSFSLELFNKLFPYYNHSRNHQTVSGQTDEVPWNYTSDIVGCMFVDGPLNVSASYISVRSNINPSKGWTANASYVKDIAEHTQLQTSGNYSETRYPEGVGYGGISYTERIFGVSAGIQSQFPRHNMNLSAVGSYSRDQAFATSNTYSLTAIYSWRIGKVFLTAGATDNFSNTTFSSGDSKTVYQYYYLTVRRRLF